MKLSRRASLVLLPAGLFSLSPPAQEWTRFRGPNGTGISTARGVPVKWTEQDYLWRVAIPGEGHSQPVIWGDKLFVTSAVELGKERLLLCLDKNTGKEVWTKSYVLPTHRP